MNVEEMLRQTMTDRADDVTGSPTIGRAGRAREQARVMRRRQYAATAVAALAVTAAGLGVNGLLRADGPPEPAPQPTRIIDVAPSFAGRTLITSEQTDDGQELVMTVDAPGGSQWLVTCAGVGADYVVHRTIDGTSEDTAVCGPLEVLGDTMSFRWAAAEPAGSGRVLRLWITRDGQVVEPEGAILAAAAYALPAPVTTLAGSDIQEVEPLDGQDWTYVDSVGSQPGERSLTHRFEALDEDALLEITSAGSGQGNVEIVIDGEVGSFPSAYSLGSTNLGNRLAAGEAHTVTLRIVGDVPADAQLAIVRRVAGQG